MRDFFSDPAGKSPAFHLLRSAGCTKAVRARDASEQFHDLVYPAIARTRPPSDEKSRLGSGHAGGASAFGSVPFSSITSEADSLELCDWSPDPASTAAG